MNNQTKLPSFGKIFLFILCSSVFLTTACTSSLPQTPANTKLPPTLTAQPPTVTPLPTTATPTTPIDTIARSEDLPLEFTSGEEFRYSNSGYVVPGYIIEKVSGKLYKEFLQESIFSPLGLENTGYDHNSKGFSSYIIRYPDGNITMILLSNSETTSFDTIMDILTMRIFGFT